MTQASIWPKPMCRQAGRQAGREGELGERGVGGGGGGEFMLAVLEDAVESMW